MSRSPTPPRRRVGVLELLSTPARTLREAAYDLLMTKQYASIMPQAVAVWCRELGHETFYATYYGIGDPRRLVPRDLDVLFVASYTQASGLAYALAKLYRRAGVRTVIGGPHARAFPADCLRFFDLVVDRCDKDVVAAIVRGDVAPGTAVTTARPLADVPPVAARLPEIRASAFAWGRWPFVCTTIPLLASTGCPYACDFCTDWDRPYRQLPLDRLAGDLRFIGAKLPRVMVGFHDPNFAVRFDEVLDVMETLPPAARQPYVMETSLSILRDGRVRRLGATNCVLVAPGVESWAGYGGKAGAGARTGARKVDAVVERFAALHEHVPYLQANFLFGVDTDAGEEPVALTREFMSRTPYVWPVVNIPHPFGGTPLFARTRAEGRLLTAMPFTFYYSPYLVTRPRHYTPAAFYRHLIALFEHFTAPAMLRRRLAVTPNRWHRLTHVLRTTVKRRRLRAFHAIVGRLEGDRDFRAFHDGETDRLPAWYQETYDRLLGRFAPLVSPAERRPVFDEPARQLSI